MNSRSGSEEPNLLARMRRLDARRHHHVAGRGAPARSRRMAGSNRCTSTLRSAAVRFCGSTIHTAGCRSIEVSALAEWASRRRSRVAGDR